MNLESRDGLDSRGWVHLAWMFQSQPGLVRQLQLIAQETGFWPFRIIKKTTALDS
jgi:hypothetical protein